MTKKLHFFLVIRQSFLDINIYAFLYYKFSPLSSSATNNTVVVKIFFIGFKLVKKPLENVTVNTRINAGIRYLFIVESLLNNIIQVLDLLVLELF